MGRSKKSWLAVAEVILAAALPAQEHTRWIADLGDPVDSEAAECALLQLGPKVAPALHGLLEAWDPSTSREEERLRAALRVVTLLGEDAVPLAPLLFATAKSDNQRLVPELIDALGSLAPYETTDQWHVVFHAAVGGGGDSVCPRLVAAVRYSVRNSCKIQDVETAQQALLLDHIFAREVAAEVLRRAGDQRAIEPLRARLVDRDRKPEGWDQVRHNGFVVPITDQFPLRAGLALVRLAPDDSRSAIGYANVALWHPHHTVRLASLRALARFGPAVVDAVPELMQLAAVSDPAIAAEALKVLGMAGDAAGPHLAAIDGIAARSQGAVHKLAGSLAARLRAMGATVPVATAVDAEATAERETLVRAVAALADGATEDVKAAEARCLAAPDAAWPLLRDRLRAEAMSAPDCLVRLLGRIGRSRPEWEREQVRGAIAVGGERWSATNMSVSTSESDARLVHREVYGQLILGAPETLVQVAAFLDHDNVAVRLAAARELAVRRAEVAKLPDQAAAEADRVGSRLLAAVRADHPDKSPFQVERNSRHVIELDLDKEIQEAAAAALLGCVHAPEVQVELLRKVLQHGDPAIVAEAIERWASSAVALELTKASRDARPEVQKAALAALERLRAK